VPHRIIRSWYTGGWWAPRSHILAVPNVTAHPSTATVGLPITVVLYGYPLLCGFNVASGD